MFFGYQELSWQCFRTMMKIAGDWEQRGMEHPSHHHHLLPACQTQVQNIHLAKDWSLFNSCRHNQGCRFQVPYRWKVWRGDPGQESSQVLLAILASTSQVCLFFSSIVTVDGNKFIHKSTAKVEGVTGHTVITEFCGDKVTRWVVIIMLRILILIVINPLYWRWLQLKLGWVKDLYHRRI